MIDVNFVMGASLLVVFILSLIVILTDIKKTHNRMDKMSDQLQDQIDENKTLARSNSRLSDKIYNLEAELKERIEINRKIIAEMESIKNCMKKAQDIKPLPGRYKFNPNDINPVIRITTHDDMGDNSYNTFEEAISVLIPILNDRIGKMQDQKHTLLIPVSYDQYIHLSEFFKIEH